MPRARGAGDYAVRVANWKFWQRRPQVRALKVRSRGDHGPTQRVDFAELAPDIETYLGQAAYLQLGYFETLTRLIRATPDLDEKALLTRAAGAALHKHRAIYDVIADRGSDPTEIMKPFQQELDAFRRKMIGQRQRETLLSVYLTSGILDDFYKALARSYGTDALHVAEILDYDDEDRSSIEPLLKDSIAADDEMRWLLSMWGRRLVGDTLLVARSALANGNLDQAAEKQVEPVFTELMHAHTQRMESLGLAA